MNTNQMKHACAMFERECPDTEHIHPAGEVCITIGRIPLLHGVRRECGGCSGKGHKLMRRAALVIRTPVDKEMVDTICISCHGLGYVPTEDFAKWLEAMMPFWRKGLPFWASPVKPIFFMHAFDTLLPLAVNGEEVIEWVKKWMPEPA